MNHLKPNEIENIGEGTILDIREQYELICTGKVKQAIHIPLGQLTMRLAEVSKEKPVYVYCMSGGRANAAVGYLTDKGYNAYNTGSVNDWNTSGYELVPHV